MQLGPHTTENNIFVAPMAGVTDRPFRVLCKKLGAGYAVSEMVTSRAELMHSTKTQRRLNHQGEQGLIAVQIAGTEAKEMAQAAVFNIHRGAQVIDINMGCPAKKVCNKWAGSALMQDEPTAFKIIQEVVQACEQTSMDLGMNAPVPVTLKMRTGWNQSNKNALTIALQAQSLGVKMITLHGRTRDMGYKGEAEYKTVKQIKAALKIPVVANGDIDSAEKAKFVLDYTGADAVMIGRAAQGRPWIFREISHYIKTGRLLAPPLISEVKALLLEHLQDHYSLYGEVMGVRSARKHIAWYVKELPNHQQFKDQMNLLQSTHEQSALVAKYFDALAERGDRLPQAKIDKTEKVYE
jgi:tRNA-dihydrouridine synthase B